MPIQIDKVIQTLMEQMKVKNPQGYQFVINLMQNNGDPSAVLNQIIGNATPEAKQNLLNQGKNYGVPNEILSKLQNSK